MFLHFGFSPSRNGPASNFIPRPRFSTASWRLTIGYKPLRAPPSEDIHHPTQPPNPFSRLLPFWVLGCLLRRLTSAGISAARHEATTTDAAPTQHNGNGSSAAPWTTDLEGPRSIPAPGCSISRSRSYLFLSCVSNLGIPQIPYCSLVC